MKYITFNPHSRDAGNFTPQIHCMQYRAFCHGGHLAYSWENIPQKIAFFKKL